MGGFGTDMQAIGTRGVVGEPENMHGWGRSGRSLDGVGERSGLR